MITFSTLAEAELTELAALDAKTNKSPWSLFNYQQSYHDENHQIIGIYRDDDYLIGACVYSQVLDEAEILQICIRYECQRQGYGEELLQVVQQRLCASNIEMLFLEVMVGNTAAINLYEKLGFNVSGTRKNYYKVNGKLVDALIMVAQL